MMQNEWEERIGHEVSREEWETTHQVYQFHPLISDSHGKDDLLKIYKLGGFGLIRSMLPDADAASIFETDIRDKQHGIDASKEALAAFERGLKSKVEEYQAFKAGFQPKDR